MKLHLRIKYSSWKVFYKAFVFFLFIRHQQMIWYWVCLKIDSESEINIYFNEQKYQVMTNYTHDWRKHTRLKM